MAGKKPDKTLGEAAKEMYDKGDDFTKAAIAAGDIGTASKFMNPHSDDDDPPSPAATSGLGRENDIKERKFNRTVYGGGSTRGPNARDTPVTMFVQDKASGNLKFLAVKGDAMNYAAEHVDLPDGTRPADLIQGARKFYFESGLRDGNLFDRYMAGDKGAHDSLQKVLNGLDPKTDAGKWGKDTWAELEQNRQQYTAAVVSAASVTPGSATTAAKPPKPCK